MVKIRPTSVEDVVGSLCQDRNVSVELFVVSSSNHRLKKINLNHLTREERSKKLENWGRDHRFVALIHIGDITCAYTFEKYAEGLKNQNKLTLDGKKISSVKGLTEEQARRLSKIALSFEMHLAPAEKRKNEKEEVIRLAGDGIEKVSSKKQSVFLVKSSSLYLFDLILKNKLGKIIVNCMRQYNEAKREMRRKEEEDLKISEIRSQVKRKEILRDEIKKTATASKA